MLFGYIAMYWRKSPIGFWKMGWYLVALCYIQFENICEYRVWSGLCARGVVVYGIGCFRGLWRAFEGAVVGLLGWSAMRACSGVCVAMIAVRCYPTSRRPHASPVARLPGGLENE